MAPLRRGMFRATSLVRSHVTDSIRQWSFSGSGFFLHTVRYTGYSVLLAEQDLVEYSDTTACQCSKGIIR